MFALRFCPTPSAGLLARRSLDATRAEGTEGCAASLCGWSTYVRYLEFSCKGDSSPLLHLLIHSVIYLHQCGLTDTYFILWVVIQYFILLLKLFQLWPLGTLSVGSCVLLPYVLPTWAVCVCVLFFFFYFFNFWHCKMFQNKKQNSKKTGLGLSRGRD